MDTLGVWTAGIICAFFFVSVLFYYTIRSVLHHRAKLIAYLGSFGFVSYVLILSFIAFYFNTMQALSFLDGISIAFVAISYHESLKDLSKSISRPGPVEDLVKAGSLVDAAVTLMRRYPKDTELDGFPVSFFEKNGFNGMDFDNVNGNTVLSLSCGVRERDRHTLLGFLSGYPYTLDIKSVHIEPKDLPKWLVDTQEFQQELFGVMADLDSSKLSTSVLSVLRGHLMAGAGSIPEYVPGIPSPELVDVAKESMERKEEKKKARRERNLRLRVRRMARQIAKKEVQRYMSSPWNEECTAAGAENTGPEKGLSGGRAV